MPSTWRQPTVASQVVASASSAGVLDSAQRFREFIATPRSPGPRRVLAPPA